MTRTPSTAPPIRVTGTDEFLATIPVLLGFHPSESLVFVPLRNTNRVLFVARVDLPRPAGLPAVVQQVAGRLPADTDRVVAVVYTDRQDVEVRARDLAALPVPVEAVVRAGNTPRPLHPTVQVAVAMEGRSVLRSRDELAASVEHVPGSCDPQAAATLAAIATLTGRDRYIAGHLATAEDTVPVLLGVAQATADDHPAADHLCGALAVLAYRTGDGALAQVAADRAVRINPRHYLTHLLREFMDAGVRPAELDTLAVGI